MEQWLSIIVQGGSWLIGVLAAAVIGKYLIDYIKTDKEQDRQDFKEEKDRIYTIVEKQNDIFYQQKDMLTQTNALIQQQLVIQSHNTDMLNGIKATMDKMNDIQMLHTNRLDRIEDRQEFIERDVKKIGDRLS